MDCVEVGFEEVVAVNDVKWENNEKCLFDPVDEAYVLILSRGGENPV